MPTPVSYLSGASLSNTVGMFKRGTIAQNLKPSLESGYRWWNGIEVTSSQYLIYSDTFTLGTTTQANATPVAYSTPDLTDQSLLNLINTLPPRIGQTAFTSLPIALQWLQSSNKFFLIRGGTENIVKSNLEVYLDAGRYDSYIGDGTTVNDLSGNGRGSTLTNGASFNTSGVGSFVLDGTDDKIVGNTFTPNITNKTLCGWVKLSNVTQSGGGLINIQGAAGEPFDAIVYNETGQGWGFGSTGFARTAWSGYKETSTTQWVFMCATYANNNYNLYRNGVLILNTTLYNAYTFNVSCRVQMGERHTGGSGVFLAGNVACGMLYSKALSPEEVLQNFNAQKYRFGYYDSVQDGLALNLDATNYLSYPRSGTTWTDLTGKGNNGTLTNGAIFSGGTTPSIVFDGSDDYVSSNSGLINNSDFSVSFWIKYQDILSASSRGIISTWDTSWNGFGIATQSGGFIRSWTNNGAGGGMNWEPTSTIKDVWANITLTYTFSTKTQRGYINSNFKISEIFGSNITHGTLQIARGGQNSSVQLALYPNTNCLMSNVQTYNKVLSPQEIIQNFESQRVYYGVTGITTNGLVLNLDAANTASYNGSGTTWVDISGSETDGILTNGPTYVSSGASSSISFDGSDDYAYNSLFSQMSLATNMTISCWCTFADNGSPGRYLWSIGRDIGGVTGGLALMAYGFGVAGGANKLLFELGSAAGRVIYTGTLQQNVWYNFTCTADGTNTKIYVNGNLDNTASQGSGQISSSPGLSVGSYLSNGIPPTPGNFFHNGKISNFLVYNRALSASEILQNHNAQKSRFGL
jgi:hypothetical protein